MSREQPMPAPEPRRGLVITLGYCPEFWRWRVASCGVKGITLRDSKGKIRIEPDQWLPWLAGRCEHGAIYVEGQRLVRPAAAPLMVPGDLPRPGEPCEPRHGPPPRDPRSRLRQAREVQKCFRIYLDKDQAGGTRWRLDGVRQWLRVTYSVDRGFLPACTCGEAPRDAVCRHGLAVLLLDPAAAVLLLRALI